MNRIIADLKAKYVLKRNGSKNNFLNVLKIFFDITLWIVILFRISNFFSCIGLYFIAKLFWLINRIIFNVDIDPRADLAGGLVIIHGLGIVIGHEVRSKGKMIVYHHVTIGGNFGKRKNLQNVNTGQPIIERNVILGIRCSVLGPVLIEADSIIGTNALITRDVGPKSMMVGCNKLLKVLK